jgi:IS30 family transposase
METRRFSIHRRKEARKSHKRTPSLIEWVAKQIHLAKRAGLGKIPDRAGIECRPKAADDRLHVGHWEGDTILHGHKNSGAATLVERRSGYLLAGFVPKLQANLVKGAIQREYEWPIEAILSERHRLRQGVQKDNRASGEQTG